MSGTQSTAARALFKTAVRSRDVMMPDQPILAELFGGSREEYWAALYDAISRSSGLGDPRRDFDLVQSELYTVEELASSPILLRFLEILIKLAGARRVLEIGAFIGLSTMRFARALPPEGRVLTIEKFDQFATVARENFRRNGLADKIELRLGDAHELIPTLPRGELFDVVFIDGDKGRYLDYFHMVAPLLSPGGLAIVDDVFFHGDAVNPAPKTEKGEGVKRFLEGIAELQGYHRITLPLGNGLTLLRKEPAENVSGSDQAVRPFLDYYKANGIIPVKQDLTDLAAHFKRRSFLYHSLHIPPGAVRGRRVMEIGPGTGDNAVHTASLEPDTYTFVDGNPYSIAALKERLGDSRYGFGRIRHLDCVEADFLTHRDARRYDLVLCEGVIHGQNDGKVFLKRVASFADQDGLVVATTQSATSILPEICRRLAKPVLAKQARSVEELRERLVALYTPHLDTLPGRSRVPADWVEDTVIMEWTPRMVFTLRDAIDAIGDTFDVYGTSPQFIQDFRWYKAAAVDGISANDVARREVAAWSPVFLDYRVDPAEFRGFDGVALERECHAIMIDSYAAWRSEDLTAVAACVDRVRRLGEWIAPAFPGTAQSVRDFVAGMTELGRGRVSEFGTFKSWFGRGQQYVSFLRRHPT